MFKESKQLVITADTLPYYIRNKPIDFTSKLSENLEDVSLIYTTLLPGPELQIAQIAQAQKIPYVVLVPYKNYSSRWPQSIINKYNYYTKKSIKKITIDREINYISEIEKPDLYSRDKIPSYFQWISDKVLNLDCKTKLLIYTRGLNSQKMTRILNLAMNSNYSKYKNIELIQSTFIDSINYS